MLDCTQDRGSLLWPGLPSPLFCQPESSPGLMAAWWALPMSTFYLSTSGSFWVCHLVFPGAALLLHLTGALWGGIQTVTPRRTHMCCIKFLIVHRCTEAWANHLPFWGHFPRLYLKKPGVTILLGCNSSFLCSCAGGIPQNPSLLRNPGSLYYHLKHWDLRNLITFLDAPTRTFYISTWFRY